MPKLTVGDADGDGLPEASASGVAGGPCACWCPVMGGDTGAGVAGQVAGVETRTAVILCGTRLAATVDPNAPDGSGAPRAIGHLRFDRGGIGRGGPGG